MMEQVMMDSTIPLIHYETLQNHLPKKGADPNYPDILFGRDATYIPAYRHTDKDVAAF
jgi:hypothetical protein